MKIKKIITVVLLTVPVVFGHGELQLQLEGSAGTLAGAPCEPEHPAGSGHQVVPSCVQQHHHSLVEASQGGHWGTYPWASYPPKQCQCCGVLQYTQSPSWYSPTQSSFALELGTAASRSHKCSQSFRPNCSKILQKICISQIIEVIQHIHVGNITYLILTYVNVNVQNKN